MKRKLSQEIAGELFEKLNNSQRSTSHSRLIILMGLPYSGKSTIAQHLQDRGFIHIWATVIKKEYNINDKQMLSVALILTEKLLIVGNSVVFDFLNHTDILRKPFIDLAQRLGITYMIVFVNTDLGIINMRQVNANKNGHSEGRSLISKEVINLISQELELPNQNDATIKVKNGDVSELDKWVENEA